MRYVDEFRQSHSVRQWSQAIHDITKNSWTLMEVCGGQTHAIVKYGLHHLLPQRVHLIHGPGCPVCVTPLEIIDHALHIASQPQILFCSYGDMLRVPGTHLDLLTLKAQGADVRIVHSPLEAFQLAVSHPQRQVVFFAVGFETTAPANAMAIYQAKEAGISNFSLLVSQVLVPPALEFLLNSPDNEIDGFLAAGHVCTITGYQDYHALANQYRVPLIITGFEPLDILQGVYYCIEQLEQGKCQVINQYRRCVKEEGNRTAQAVMHQVFEVVDCCWRGIGMIPKSGLGLRKSYADYDAALRFPLKAAVAPKDNGCLSGLILQGKKKPAECPLFGKTCTPQNPLGAPMVSNEGACAAYYHYSNHRSLKRN